MHSDLPYEYYKIDIYKRRNFNNIKIYMCVIQYFICLHIIMQVHLQIYIKIKRNCKQLNVIY